MGGGCPPGTCVLPLTTDAARPRSDLAELAAATVLEGCVGETLAALEAELAARECGDPVVREVLEQIADDELRHAELAWRFVKWALGRGGDPVRHAVGRAFERAAALPGPDPDRAPKLAVHGHLDGRTRRSLRRHALDEAILPCARALLRGAGAQPAARFV